MAKSLASHVVFVPRGWKRRPPALNHLRSLALHFWWWGLRYGELTTTMNMGDLDSVHPQPDRIRLHITPLNAEIYNRIIPPSLQPLASNASFHNIQTFPERDYGFVELPAMEAQKLKKKLNGSTLKGSKMSVEEARPLRKRKSEAEVDVDEGERKKAKREETGRKRRREDGVIEGHELKEGRRIKRGWSGEDSKGARDNGKRRDSKEAAHDQGEQTKLRFKTNLPANKTPTVDEREKRKKDKKGKKGKGADQTVVEEFAKRRKSRQDIALPNGARPGSQSYKDGKGWIDEDGQVVEPERKSRRRMKQRSASPDEKSQSQALEVDAVLGAADDRAGSGNGADESTEEQISDAESPEGSEESEDADPQGQTAGVPKEVHPLEALFKRPGPATSSETPKNTTPSKPRPAPIDTSFSFFGSGGGDADDDDVDMDGSEAGNAAAKPPVTPHTKQDLEWRSLRSAAPTPDTAAIGRKFSFPFANEDLDEDEDEDKDMDVGDGQGEEAQNASEEAGQWSLRRSAKGDGKGKEESAFRKWFFENRGDLNRGWKKRRREERKVKRQRENRRLGRKVA